MSKKIQPICEICNKNSSKYKCPGCLIQTCCLECVRSHKESRKCNGKRKVNGFVSLQEFDYCNLVDDMSFLESSARKVRCMDNSNFGASLNGHSTSALSHRCSRVILGKLTKAAAMRNINLKLAPFLTSRRKQNSTYCNASNAHKVSRTTKMFWHIRWIFGDNELEERSVDESAIVKDLLNRFLSNEYGLLVSAEAVIFRAKVKETQEFVDDKDFKNELIVGMEAEHLNKSNSVYVLDPSKSLRDNFQGKTIVEHPILRIIPESRISDYSQEES